MVAPRFAGERFQIVEPQLLERLAALRFAPGPLNAAMQALDQRWPQRVPPIPDLTAVEAEVRALIEQEAQSYESPAEVVKWFYMQPQRLSEMEGLALEANVFVGNAKTQKPSVDRVTMQQYVAEHSVIRTYLQWKKVEKRRQMVETLINHLEPDGYIRASYMQAGADTFRMSCRNPNLQQVPRDPRFRICVQAPAGWKMVVADFAQMELRLAAAEAQDELMIGAFQDGLDLHTLTAMEIYDVPEEAVTKEQRQIAKSANFGLLYGSGAKGLRQYAAGMGIEMDLDEASEVRQKFHAAYAGINAWQRRAAHAADTTKGIGQVRVRVSNLRRFLPGDHNKLTTRCNTPIQAAGAAVLKRTLGMLWPLLLQSGEDEVRLSGVVHDEIILVAREDVAEKWAETLQTTMEKAESEWLGKVPALAEAHVGSSWLDAK